MRRASTEQVPDIGLRSAARRRLLAAAAAAAEYELGREDGVRALVAGDQEAGGRGAEFADGLADGGQAGLDE